MLGFGEKNYASIVAPLKKIEDKDKSYFKALVECMINLQAEIMNKIPKSENPVGHQPEDNLPIQYIQILHTMAQISGYIINSTSWIDGEYHGFDKFEVSRKLARLKAFM